MSQDASALPEGSYFDPQLGMVVTEAGKAKWRNRLTESKARRDANRPQRDALREQLRLGPAAQA